MPPNMTSHNERALAALLKYIARERDHRREEILDAARSEAAELVRDSRRQARARVQETIEQQRRELDARLRAARAAEESRLRGRQHEIVRDLLDQAWPMLEDQLRRRWESAAGRQAWISMTLATARRHLPDGNWTIEHPGNEPTEAAEAALAELGAERPGVAIEWSENSDLEAGIRIRMGRAALDTTTTALLGHRDEVEGLLLGWLAAHAEPAVRSVVTGGTH